MGWLTNYSLGTSQELLICLSCSTSIIFWGGKSCCANAMRARWDRDRFPLAGRSWASTGSRAVRLTTFGEPEHASWRTETCSFTGLPIGHSIQNSENIFQTWRFPKINKKYEKFWSQTGSFQDCSWFHAGLTAFLSDSCEFWFKGSSFFCCHKSWKFFHFFVISTLPNSMMFFCWKMSEAATVIHLRIPLGSVLMCFNQILNTYFEII